MSEGKTIWNSVVGETPAALRLLDLTKPRHMMWTAEQRAVFQYVYETELRKAQAPFRQRRAPRRRGR